MKLSITDTDQNNVECHNSECHILFIVVLSVLILSVVISRHTECRYADSIVEKPAFNWVSYCHLGSFQFYTPYFTNQQHLKKNQIIKKWKQ